MKKNYIKPELSLTAVDNSEVICGSVYLDNVKAQDLQIYDEDEDPKVNLTYDPTWGAEDTNEWQLW